MTKQKVMTKQMIFTKTKIIYVYSKKNKKHFFKYVPLYFYFF